jgi:hypothetical protein
MAIEFPLSPSIDDQFTAYGKTWYWDGEKWIFASTNPETISAVSPITYETVTQTIGIEEDRLISFVTSETRPESPVDGQIIFETDTALYFGWNGSEWTSIGENLSSITPENLGTAAVGVATDAARGDHVHNMPSASDVGADPVGSASAVAGDLTTHEGLTTSVHGISDTADLVYTGDSRLSDARTPTAHASSHESGGSDELELAPSQVTGTAVVADDVHLISFVTSSTRPETPSEGQVIYESDTSLYFGWDGSEWASIGSGNEIYIVTYEYTATTNQTIFTGSDDNSLSMSFTDDLIQVFLNGVLLNPNDDYTTSEDTVTLTSGAASGDSLTVVAFASFNVANTYTIAEADAAIASATAGLGGATGGGADQVFYENDVAVTTSYTISTDKNAMSAGPVEIESGATITIPSGSVWSVV